MLCEAFEFLVDGLCGGCQSGALKESAKVCEHLFLILAYVRDHAENKE